MKLTIYFYILLVICSAFSLACGTSQGATAGRGEVVFDDGYGNSSDGEVIIDDRYIHSDEQPVSTASESSADITRTIADNSEILVKYDGYGNKTETRIFRNHPRITTILIRTAANGQKQFYVYGYGDVKNLPDEMLDKALTASADEIANAAGLYEKRSNEEITNFRKSSQQNLTPLSDFNFPVQIPQNAPILEQGSEPSTALTEDSSSENKAVEEPPVRNQPPQDEK